MRAREGGRARMRPGSHEKRFEKRGELATKEVNRKCTETCPKKQISKILQRQRKKRVRRSKQPRHGPDALRSVTGSTMRVHDRCTILIRGDMIGRGERTILVNYWAE